MLERETQISIEETHPYGLSTLLEATERAQDYLSQARAHNTLSSRWSLKMRSSVLRSSSLTGGRASASATSTRAMASASAWSVLSTFLRLYWAVRLVLTSYPYS